MPTSLHPQAKFDPIPPDLDLHSLVQDTPNFEWATHISASEIYALGQQRFEKLVSIHVVNGGKPLVIRNWNDRLPTELFSAQWLEDAYNRKEERVWDINGKANIPMTMGHYLRSMKQLTDQWTPRNFRDERRQRLYLKDMDCPPEWYERLSKVLPRSIFYLNEDIEGGSHHHHSRRRGLADNDDDDDMFVDDHPISRAGDLMSSLPPAMRAENLMCYIGHEGTYTPAHREMCASLGQNIMVETSGSENGEKPGSSIWFMTETKDRDVVGEYFLSMLGHDVDIEKHFAQINAWKKAAFPVYIVEQRLGDLILVPPLAPHQVWNRGTRTMKVAWNRTVVETLEMALHEALPKARLVCRDEQYKNKAIVYYTLKKYFQELEYAQADGHLASFGLGQDLGHNSLRRAQVADDFKRLLRLFSEILVDEMFSTKEPSVEYIPFDSNITCSYCRANIFNRFLTCKHCVRLLATGDEDTYDVCMECYAMGRSCMCVSRLGWCEQWPWEELVGNYERWQAMVVSNDGYFDAFASPPALEVARLRSARKPVAQICQEQLRRRPFRDITQPVEKEVLEPSEPEVDDEGKVVKKKVNKRQKKKGDTYRCHVCCHRDHTYRLAFCNTPGCQEAYCYGVLYRGFDMMPQSVMQQAYWQCPKCMKICNCGACRRTGTTNPYIPKGTLLGHDTRPIADDRSVESLINFRLHNLMWLKNCGEEGRSIASKRMQRLRQEADAAKALEGDSPLDNGFSTMQSGSQAEDGGGAATRDGPDNAAAADSVHQGQPGRDGSGGANPPGDRSHVNPALLANGPASPYPALEDGDYPEPPTPFHGSEMAATAFGRAYYMDDDDTANKILFDPYQEPPPSAMVGSLGAMSTLPEFLEGYRQRPARRPRLEKDLDPDYTGPKSHKKRAPPAQPATDTADPDLNLDPALLTVQRGLPAGGDRSLVPLSLRWPPVITGAAGLAGGSAHAQHAASAGLGAPAAPASGAVAFRAGALWSMVHPERLVERADRDSSDNSDSDASARGYPANVPELRHARPMLSYRDEVASGDEADEDADKAGKATPAQPIEGATAIALEGVVATVEVEPAAAAPAPAPQPPALPPAPATTATDTPEAQQPRKRGRPPVSFGGDPAAAATPAGREPAAKRRLSSGGSLGRAVETAGTPPGSGVAAKRRPGRPPGPGRKQDSSEGQVILAGALPAPPAPPPPAVSSSAVLPPPITKFMSLAERMALKGKKFKVAGKAKKAATSGGAKARDVAVPASAADVTSIVAATAALPSVAIGLAKGSSGSGSGGSSKPKAGDVRKAPTDLGNGNRPVVAPAATARRPLRVSSSSDSSDGDQVKSRGKAPPSFRPSRGALSSRGRGGGVGLGRRPLDSPASGPRHGPTIVRLAESENEEEEEEAEEEKEEEDDSYDTDEYDGDGRGGGRGSGRGNKRGTKSTRGHSAPGADGDSASDSGGSAQRVTFFARRGSTRGRGRGRGRPRGRPVGRARG